MENISHYGDGNFGYKVVFSNGQVAYSWFPTKSLRDSSMKKSKSKMLNKKSISAVER